MVTALFCRGPWPCAWLLIVVIAATGKPLEDRGRAIGSEKALPVVHTELDRGVFEENSSDWRRLHGDDVTVSKKEERHVEESAITWTISMMLFGFLLINVLVLYQVRSRDPNIRTYVYRMISDCFSIFLAVLGMQALESFFLEQILPSPIPRGLNIKPVPLWLKLLVQGTIYLICFTMISVACYSFRDSSHHYLKGLRTLSSHVCAFSGIFFFYSFTESEEHEREHEENWFQKAKGHQMLILAAIAFGAWILMILLRVISSLCKSSEQEHWHQEVRAGQNEATLLITSFLVNQTLCFWILGGEIPELEGTEVAERNWHHVSMMLYCSLGFLMLTLLMTAVYALAQMWASASRRLLQYHWALHNTQQFLAISVSWSLYRLGDWAMQVLLVNTWHVSNKALVYVLTAFIASLIAIAVIRYLDLIADHLEDEDVDRMFLHSGSEEHTEGTPLRVVIGSFALLVGLCWDKAFSAANQFIVHNTPVSRDHPVFAKCIAAAALCCFVLPAWIWYIVPNAAKSEKEHAATIKAERGSDSSEEDNGEEDSDEPA